MKIAISQNLEGYTRLHVKHVFLSRYNDECAKFAHVDGEIDGQERRRRDRATTLLRSGRTSFVDLPHLCTFRKLLR